MSHEAILKFKVTVKPEWVKLTPSLIVARWKINEVYFCDAIDPTVTSSAYGWVYENN